MGCYYIIIYKLEIWLHFRLGQNPEILPILIEVIKGRLGITIAHADIFSKKWYGFQFLTNQITKTWNGRYNFRRKYQIFFNKTDAT